MNIIILLSEKNIHVIAVDYGRIQDFTKGAHWLGIVTVQSVKCEAQAFQGHAPPRNFEKKNAI